MVCADTLADDAQFELAPCGCAVCSECLTGMPSGVDALKGGKMVLSILKCEGHGRPLLKEALSAIKFHESSDARGLVGALDARVMCAVTVAVQAAVKTTREAPEVSAGLKPFLDAALDERSPVEVLALETARVVETYRYAVCEAEGCGKGFFFVGGCAEVEGGAFRRCFGCKAELECAWDAGVFRCANPTCRRFLLREASSVVGMAQCNMTGCVCMGMAKVFSATGEVVGVAEEDQLHGESMGTCARCHGLGASAGSFYPMVSRDHWRHHVFQRGARVTLPASYVYDASGKVNAWVRAKDKLAPRLVELAERDARFPGYCGCHEFKSLVEEQLAETEAATLEEAEEALGAVLKGAGPLVERGAVVNWASEVDDAQHDGAVAMDSLVLPNLATLMARAQWAVDHGEDMLAAAWRRHNTGALAFDMLAEMELNVRSLLDVMNDAIKKLKSIGYRTLAYEYNAIFTMHVLQPLRTVMVSVMLGVLHSRLRTPAMCVNVALRETEALDGLSGWDRVEVFRAEQRVVARLTQWSGRAVVLRDVGYRAEVRKVVSAHVQPHVEMVLSRACVHLPLLLRLSEAVRPAGVGGHEAWRAQVRALLTGALPTSDVPEMGATWLETGVLYEVGLLIVWTLGEMIKSLGGEASAVAMSHDVVDDCADMLKSLQSGARLHGSVHAFKLLEAAEDKFGELVMSSMVVDEARELSRRVRRRLE